MKAICECVSGSAWRFQEFIIDFTAVNRVKRGLPLGQYNFAMAGEQNHVDDMLAWTHKSGKAIAARLEGANKAFGTGILLSEATACQLPASVGLRHLDNVVVKGKSQAVKVFTPDDRADIRAASALLVERFYAGQHTQALAAAKEVLALLPQDKPAQRFVERLQAQEPYAQALSLDKL